MVQWPPAPTEVAGRGNAQTLCLACVGCRLFWLGYRNLECVHTQELCFAVDLRGCCSVCESFMGPRLMAIGGCGWIV